MASAEARLNEWIEQKLVSPAERQFNGVRGQLMHTGALITVAALK